jgi:hypothetical protein
MNISRLLFVNRYRHTRLFLWAGLLLCAATTAGMAEQLEIADSAGKPVLVLARDGDRLSVSDGTGAVLIRGERKGSERTLYSLPDGTPIAIAQGAGERFKIESQDGRLLRKVKREGDRIKIADNAENTDAAVLRRRGDDKWELERNDESLGKIKRYPDQDRLKVRDRDDRTRYTLTGTRLTPVPLVLLIADLPPAQSAAIMVEIWVRGW